MKRIHAPVIPLLLTAAAVAGGSAAYASAGVGGSSDPAGAADARVAARQAEPDRNHDGIPDRWEKRYGLSLEVDQRGRDQDHDGLTNLSEYRSGTDPRDADSDDDGVRDGSEDRDHDGLGNLAEQQHDTSQDDRGSDHDGGADRQGE